MEQAKQKEKNLNLFTSDDLLKAMDLKVGDEVSFLDNKFRIVELKTYKLNYEIKLFLLNDAPEEKYIFIILTSLINIPFEKVN